MENKPKQIEIVVERMTPRSVLSAVCDVCYEKRQVLEKEKQLKIKELVENTITSDKKELKAIHDEVTAIVEQVSKLNKRKNELLEGIEVKYDIRGVNYNKKFTLFVKNIFTWSPFENHKEALEIKAKQDALRDFENQLQNHLSMGLEQGIKFLHENNITIISPIEKTPIISGLKITDIL